MQDTYIQACLKWHDGVSAGCEQTALKYAVADFFHELWDKSKWHRQTQNDYYGKRLEYILAA